MFLALILPKETTDTDFVSIATVDRSSKSKSAELAGLGD
jgi:hypothetical protein